jgi:magnesium transporter
MENEFISTEQIEKLIDEKKVKEIRQLFEVVPTIDIAEAVSDIEDTKKIIFIFKTVKSEYTADLFTELKPEVKEDVINLMSNDELADVLEQQFTDDLVDDLEELPANVVTRVLRNVSKERRATINKLLNYKEDSAGSIMTTEFVALLSNLTADEAIKEIRRTGKNKETIYTLFVMDKKRNLVGIVDLDDLIFAKGDTVLTEIMNRDFVTVNVNDDQEEVANIVKRYDLNAIAVLNNDGRLIGLITVDDIMDIIEEETTEDISKMQMVTPLEDSYLETSPVKMAKKCIPWIIVLLILGTFSSMVLSIFEDRIASIAILAAFIPVLMDTGGNAGGQTIALMIRGLSLQEFSPRDFWKVIRKESISAAIIAVIVGIFAFVWFSVEQYFGIVSNSNLGYSASIWIGNCWSMEFFVEVIKVSGLVAGTLVIAMFLSKMVAVLLPMGAAAIKKDPAIVSQPLLTTIVDVTSLLVYFGIASLIFVF